MKIHGMRDGRLPAANQPGITGDDERVAAARPEVAKVSLGDDGRLDRRVMPGGIARDRDVIVDRVGDRHGEELQRLPARLDEGLEDPEIPVDRRDREPHSSGSRGHERSGVRATMGVGL
jgi:hypothetical protein